MGVQPLSDGGVGVVGVERIRVRADGAVEFAAPVSQGMLMGGVPIPERLGGGFLFWSMHGLYRTPTFTGELQPVTSLPTNVFGVEFGPDRTFMFGIQSSPVAFEFGLAGAT
jgi:hypothetical protein